MKLCPGCPTPEGCKKAGKCLNTKDSSGPKVDPVYKACGGTVFKGR